MGRMGIRFFCYFLVLYKLYQSKYSFVYIFFRFHVSYFILCNIHENYTIDTLSIIHVFVRLHYRHMFFRKHVSSM